MDELDLRICRALITNGDRFAYSTPIRRSVRQVARELRVDHLTVAVRIRRLQDKGFLSGWKVLPNPRMFGYRMRVLFLDLPSRSPKQDMMRKLKLIQGVVHVSDYIGDSLGVSLLYDSDLSLSRTIELISRITNAENVTQVGVSSPPSKTNRLSETDWAIVRSLESDAMKPYVRVAREIGLTPKTVKNRLMRLERESALSMVPSFDLANVEGMVGSLLLYSYTVHDAKSAVDQTVISHFDGNYLLASMSDGERAYLILLAPTMGSVKSYLEWMKEQPGVATARVYIPVETVNLWSRANELFGQRSSSWTSQSKKN